MNNLKNNIGFRIIIIILSLSIASPVNAAGFIFSWKPIVADSGLALGIPGKDMIIKDANIDEMNASRQDHFDDRNDDATTREEKKKSPLNIQFTFLPKDAFMTKGGKAYTNSDDEQASRIIDAMKSLIDGDSKIKSLESLGKTIEPQINFYFEF